MKLKLAIFLISFIYFQPELSAQVEWQEDDVTIIGTVLNFNESKKQNNLRFYFRDIIKNGLLNKYIPEIDDQGNFLLTVPILYPQEFYLNYGFVSLFICSPGDTLEIEIDKEQKSANVIAGNRVKDNEDFNQFIAGKTKIDPQYSPDVAKDKTALEFSSYIEARENKFRTFFQEYKEENNTSQLLNLLIEDILKYETLSDLIAYPQWYSSQNKIKQDSLELPQDYYKFLEEYNMEDDLLFSIKHADFLHHFNRHILKHPKDSAEKANKFFQQNDILKGVEVLLNMINQNTTGFTKDLCLTKFYLQAISGKDLKGFETMYDSSLISDPFFREVISKKHQDLQKYMANQNTGSANIDSIDSKIVTEIIDTITSKYNGKVIYIDFWATWCTPCIAEFPNSKSLQQLYQNKDVIFLFLANRCKKDAWKATIANQNLTGEHFLLTDAQYNVFSKAFGISGIPHYAIIDKDGDIISKDAPRPGEKEQIKFQIDELLVD
ncbi:TlpA family protein disulfide reductase [Flexithrix dorotheae]|uniref:TlpA family protein disulfide reductase n=1 Tax=Flexithrix dorotheae TaxID=70993 RepID=UPI00036184C6|nr:TlpA disulfide reductase family protein [Flexithrix dorotheae]